MKTPFVKVFGLVVRWTSTSSEKALTGVQMEPSNKRVRRSLATIQQLQAEVTSHLTIIEREQSLCIHAFPPKARDEEVNVQCPKCGYVEVR